MNDCPDKHSALVIELEKWASHNAGAFPQSASLMNQAAKALRAAPSARAPTIIERLLSQDDIGRAELIFAVVDLLLEDVAADPSKLKRAQEIARRDIPPHLTVAQSDKLRDLVRNLTALHEPHCRVVEPPYGECNCVTGRICKEAAAALGRMPSHVAAIQPKDETERVIRSDAAHAIAAFCSERRINWEEEPLQGIVFDLLNRAFNCIEQRGAVNQQGCSRSEASVATERTDRPSAVSSKEQPVAWVDVHDRTCLYFEKPSQVDVAPLYRAPVSATLNNEVLAACETLRKLEAEQKADVPPTFQTDEQRRDRSRRQGSRAAEIINARFAVCAAVMAATDGGKQNG